MVSQSEFNRKFARALAKTTLTPPQITDVLSRIFNEIGLDYPETKYPRYPDPFTILGLYNTSELNPDEKDKLAQKLIENFGIELDPKDVPFTYNNLPLVGNKIHRYHFVNTDIQNRDSVVDRVWDSFREIIRFADGEALDADFIESFDYCRTVKGFQTRPPKMFTFGLYYCDFDKFIFLDDSIISYLKIHGIAVPKELDGRAYLSLVNDIKLYLKRNNLTFDEVSGIAYKMKKGQAPAPETTKKQKWPLNTIFYGPPGTGKTYLAKKMAIEIVTGTIPDDSEVDEKFRTLMKQGNVSFTTFHQSYGYEEFIEGYKPVTLNEGTDDEKMVYKIQNGVFKQFCRDAVPNKSVIIDKIPDNVTIWKMSLGESSRRDIHDDCIKNGYIRLGYDEDLELLSKEYIDSKKRSLSSVNAFIYDMSEGDIVLIRNSPTTIDAVARVIGPYEVDPTKTEYRQIRKVEWLYKEGKPISLKELPNSKKLVQTTLYRIEWLTSLDILRLIEPAAEHGNDRYVFIIDEINRGNVSRIFGETITLIEDNKRSKAGDIESRNCVKLSYSGSDFWIPDNVYVIGTMNTADRSLVALDTALRRRFNFKKKMPMSNLIPRFSSIKTVDLVQLLDTLNHRIEVLYDQEHLLGHSFFMGIDDESQLKDVFDTKIIPLLEEYFHNDYERVINVLSIKNDPEKSPLIKREESESSFESSVRGAKSRYTYIDVEDYSAAIRSLYE